MRVLSEHGLRANTCWHFIGPTPAGCRTCISPFPEKRLLNLDWPVSAGRNSIDGRVAPQPYMQPNHTLLWASANHPLQPLFYLFQRFVGPKLSLFHAQLIKIAEVRSGCPKMSGISIGGHVRLVALGIAASALKIVNTYLSQAPEQQYAFDINL